MLISFTPKKRKSFQIENWFIERIGFTINYCKISNNIIVYIFESCAKTHTKTHELLKT
jgi:hypothetical protein